MREQADDAEAANTLEGPPRYPVSPRTQYVDANWQHIVAPPTTPQTLASLPRTRHGGTGVAPFGQLALAFAMLAPSWGLIQMSLTVAYDGLPSMVGLALGSLMVPVLTILAVVVLGVPVRLIPWASRRWSGNGRLYVAIAVIGLGLMAAGSLVGVRQVGTENGIAYDTFTPEPSLLYSGWFLLAFLLVNASLPIRWTRRP